MNATPSKNEGKGSMHDENMTTTAALNLGTAYAQKDDDTLPGGMGFTQELARSKDKGKELHEMAGKKTKGNKIIGNEKHRHSS